MSRKYVHTVIAHITITWSMSIMCKYITILFYMSFGTKIIFREYEIIYFTNKEIIKRILVNNSTSNCTLTVFIFH